MLKKLAALPILAFIVLIEPLQAFAQQTAPQPSQGYYGSGPWHMWHGGYGWHFLWMFPLMMLVFLLVCGIVFLVAHRFCGHGLHCWVPSSHMMNRSWGDPSYSALQILNERFARGEIQKDEYTEKKATILSSGRS
jgi:putative membrane protein